MPRRALLAIHGDLDEYGSVEFARRIAMSVPAHAGDPA